MSNQTTAYRDNSEAAPSNTPDYSQQPVYVGDPVDKEVIKALSKRAAIPYIFCIILMVANIIQYVRNPTIITAVIKEDGQQVVKINDIDYGSFGAVTVQPDKPGNRDKIYLVKQFTKQLFGIDPQARKYQLENAYNLLASDFAAKYYTDYKASGLLDKQRNERWQAKWEIQKVEIDPRDPYLIHVIGTQDITKFINDKTEREVVQRSLDFKLADDAPRSERNLLTAFLIAKFGGEELSRTNPPSIDGQSQLPN